MGLQANTRKEIELGVSRKKNFKRGNVSGKWEDKHSFTSRTLAQLPSDFVKVLNEHSKVADLFVLYSYQTPMAWYSLNDSDSNGTGKWYYVDEKYSISTTQHQNAFRYALKGQNVVTLSVDENGNVTEVEKEFY